MRLYMKYRGFLFSLSWTGVIVKNFIVFMFYLIPYMFLFV